MKMGSSEKLLQRKTGLHWFCRLEQFTYWMKSRELDSRLLKRLFSILRIKIDTNETTHLSLRTVIRVKDLILIWMYLSTFMVIKSEKDQFAQHVSWTKNQNDDWTFCENFGLLFSEIVWEK